MRCRRDDEIWQGAMTDGDPGWADHLADCPTCRAAADEVARLRRLLQTVPETSPAVALRLRVLTADVGMRSFSCTDVRARLDAYRDGELSTVETFLLEDHLLWCAACAGALAQAEAIGTALRTLPQLTPPEAIAERIAAARQPWWQRLWKAPAPSWSPGRLFQVGGALAAVALACAIFLSRPPGDHLARGPQPPSRPVNPVTMEQPNDAAQPADAGQPVTAPAGRVTGPAAIATATRRPTDDTAAARPAHVPVAAAAAVPEPALQPSSKTGGIALAALTPSRSIAARASVDDAPVQPDLLRAPTPASDPAPRKLGDLAARPHEANYDATAREAIESLHREAWLAECDDELSNPPSTLRLAVALPRHEPMRISAYAMPADATDELNKVLDRNLQRTSPGRPAPVTIRSSEGDRTNGVLFTIH